MKRVVRGSSPGKIYVFTREEGRGFPPIKIIVIRTCLRKQDLDWRDRNRCQRKSRKLETDFLHKLYKANAPVVSISVALRRLRSMLL